MTSNAAYYSPGVRRGPSRALGVGLWIAQVALAVPFGLAGLMKSTLPMADLAKNVPWAPDAPAALVRLIGVAELAGAFGLLLPSLTRIAPVLTPLAAAGLAVVMALATAFHVHRGELAALGLPVLLGVLAAVVAWGRFGRARIVPRD
jgi:putative oxidoreductase